MAMVDETADAVCIISLEGLVQHVNAPFLRMFGYRKVGAGAGGGGCAGAWARCAALRMRPRHPAPHGCCAQGELEGSNVMRIMPQPFSGQHDCARGAGGLGRPLHAPAAGQLGGTARS